MWCVEFSSHEVRVCSIEWLCFHSGVCIVVPRGSVCHEVMKVSGVF